MTEASKARLSIDRSEAKGLDPTSRASIKAAGMSETMRVMRVVDAGISLRAGAGGRRGRKRRRAEERRVPEWARLETRIHLSPEAYARMMDLIEAPPEPPAALVRLMRR